MFEVVDRLDQAQEAYCEQCDVFLTGVLGYRGRKVEEVVMLHRSFEPQHEITLIGEMGQS